MSSIKLFVLWLDIPVQTVTYACTPSKYTQSSVGLSGIRGLASVIAIDKVPVFSLDSLFEPPPLPQPIRSIKTMVAHIAQEHQLFMRKLLYNEFRNFSSGAINRIKERSKSVL
jgi:hypothetical protein